MFRVVPDINVLISARLKVPSQPNDCVQLIIQRRVTGIISNTMLQRYVSKLRGKFRASDEEVDMALHDLTHVAEVIDAPPLDQPMTQDPEDDLVLACAVAGRATHIVTGDKRHLLPLRDYRDIRIVTATAFLREVEEATTGT